MTIWHCVGSVPFGRPCRNTGKYYTPATFQQAVGLLPWNVDHWQHDDYIGRYPARYTAFQTVLIVDLWLDDAIPAEAVALDAIRLGEMYLSHGAGDACRTPAGSRAAWDKQQQRIDERGPVVMNDIAPMGAVDLTHIALVRVPAMPQDDAVTVVRQMSAAEVPVIDLAGGEHAD